jgi:hypothetical protein
MIGWPFYFVVMGQWAVVRSLWSGFRATSTPYIKALLKTPPFFIKVQVEL